MTACRHPSMATWDPEKCNLTQVTRCRGRGQFPCCLEPPTESAVAMIRRLEGWCPSFQVSPAFYAFKLSGGLADFWKSLLLLWGMPKQLSSAREAEYMPGKIQFALRAWIPSHRYQEEVTLVGHCASSRWACKKK